MGHEFVSTVLQKPEASAPRYRVAAPAVGRLDPIATVDAAVRTVLAELVRPTSARVEPGARVFLDRLFSVRHAEALPGGTKVVRIGPGTVVTPLAYDLLKRQGITIRLGGTSAAQRRAAGEWAFAIDARSGLSHALRRSLLEDPRTWDEVEPSLDVIAHWLTSGEGRGALWITSEVALAVWRACRISGVRAASAVEPGDVHAAVRGLGLNLLLIDPAGKSISWIRQMAAAFRLNGAPALPETILVEAQR